MSSILPKCTVFKPIFLITKNLPCLGTIAIIDWISLILITYNPASSIYVQDILVLKELWSLIGSERSYSNTKTRVLAPIFKSQNKVILDFSKVYSI